MLDVLIRGATVVDGSGAPGFLADVGLRDGLIAALGDLSGTTAEHVVAAAGLVIAPGFIDMHSHDDAVMLAEAPYTAKLTQGITTVVVGNCGFSLAPAPDRDQRDILTDVLLGHHQWPGATFAEYLDALDARRPLLNVAALVGHGTVRVAVMGFDGRPAGSADLQAMAGWIEEAMAAGAFGMSSGLIYSPNCFCDTGELVTLARVVAQYGGLYASHIRGEANGVMRATEEAIAVGEQAGLPAHISHIKVTGRKNWGRSREVLGLVDRARGRGLDVTADTYPYNAGSTTLSSLLPPWAHEGGPEKLLSRLREPAQRRLLRDALSASSEDWWNPLQSSGAENILLTWCPDTPQWQGQTLSVVAAQQGADAPETLLDILLATKARAHMVVFGASDADLRDYLRHPWIMIGTDGLPSSPMPHPRAYGSCARVLGHFVRDEGVLSLPEAIRKMTSLPAQRLGLTGRGRIQVGDAADLVLFDPETIQDRATYQDPVQPPAGIHSVWVNGVLALDQGRLAGDRAGRVLRHRGRPGAATPAGT